MWKRVKHLWRMSRQPHVSRADIVAGLRALGVSAGDLIQAHSSLSSFGYIEGGASAVVDALLESVAPGGTVMVPTFNHGAEEIFDLHASPSHNGAISETFRHRPEAVRSFHPTHAYAAIGPLAAELCANHLEAGTFTMDSPLGKLARRGGWLLLLGVGMNRCTAAHLGECMALSHCIGWGKQPRWVRDPQTGQVHSVRGDLWRSGDCLIEWDPLEKRIRERGLIADGRIGPCHVMRMRAQDVIDISFEMARELCPRCPTLPLAQ